MNVSQSYFNYNPQAEEIYAGGSQLMIGQVEKVHYVGDSTNKSKQFIEYDVSVRDPHGGQSTIRNIRKMEGLGGTNDFSECVLEANDFAFEGVLEPANFFKNKNGTLVIVAFLNNNFEKPFILGAFAHPKTVGSDLSKSIQRRSEFRGFRQEIDKDGNATITALGAKTPDGKPADPTFTPVTFKVGKDGKIETTAGHKISFVSEKGKEQIKIQTSANQLFIIDDTAGKESISMLQKKGGLVNIDKDGSVTVTSSDGNLLFLNAAKGEASLIQKNGAMVALSATAATISDPTGKQVISCNEDTVQITSSKDITTQTSGFGVQAGTAQIKDTIGAGFKVSGGLVALGGPAAELLDLVNQLLTQLISLTTAMATETHIGNLGYPTSPPINAAAYAAVQAQITVIQALLLTIKGTL